MIRSVIPVLLVGGLSVGLPPGAAASDVIRGVVFDDRDGDGARDPGEVGVPGVAVSNGRDVVTTGPEGRYRLDLEQRSIAFVTKPAGWAVPVGENHLPRFFYTHYPEGVAADLDLRFPGPAPSGTIDGPIDFPLRRVEEPDRFEVIWFSDPQPQTPAEIDYVRDDVVAELIGTDAAFGITVGDIMYDDLSLFPRYNRVVGRIGIPWYNVPGNHDMNYRVEDDRDSLETFKRYFGPPYYSFDYGRAHFVVLDTVSYLGHGARRTGRGYYEGRLDERQLTWLANDLALVPPERLLVLAMHIPLRSYFTEDPAGVSVENLDALLEILAGREAVLAVAGHLHNNEHHHLSRADGFDSPVPLHLHTLAAVSGSWWSGPPDERGIPWALQSDGTPNGYHVMMVDGTRVQMRYRAAGRPAEHQMRISFETARDDGRRSGRRRARSRDGVPVGRVGLDRVPATEILVNLFDGGPASRVDVRVGEREPVEMTRVRRPDPFVERLLRQHGKTMKSFVRAVPCSHLWSAGLPDDLGPGVHAIQVTASDDYGQRHEGRAILEVE